VSSPEPGRGRSRPLRMAGLALLGVAVGAALVGLVTLGSGPRDGGGGAIGTPPATESAQTGATTSTSATTTPGEQGTAPTTTTTAPAPTETTTTSAAPPPPAPPPPPPPTAPIRVYNNSTITGLAARAANDFTQAGWPVEEVSNYAGGRIPTSTVYYQPGTGQEAAAQRLADQFELRVAPRFSGIAGASPGLIVIVTNDYGSK
jgi:hypothetical protein